MKWEFNEKFLNALHEKIPERARLTNYIYDILQIEKEAVYRRLRGNVAFTLSEALLLSKELGISLDNLTGIEEKTRPLQLTMVDYIKPEKRDYEMFYQYVKFLKTTNEDPDSELAEVSNSLPDALWSNFPFIRLFYLFRWNYHTHSGLISITPLRDIQINDNMAKIYQGHYLEARKIKNTIYIWDPLIFTYLYNDIISFKNLNLIQSEEIKILKNELLDFLDYTEKLAETGKFDVTGNKFNLYISEFNLDTSYSYVYSKIYRLVLMKTFSINSIASTDDYIFNHVQNWIQSFKRLSTFISETGEKSRIAFFKKQRELINQL